MSHEIEARPPSELEAWLEAFLRDPGFLEAYPYSAAILAKLTPVADPSVGRMAVSLYDGRFFLHLNVESFLAEPQFLRGVLLHEVHHVVLGHLTHPKFAEVEEPELMDLAVEMSANEYIEELLPPAITCRAYAAVGIRAGQSTWERYEILVRWLQTTGKRPRPSPGEEGSGTIDDHRFFGRGKAMPGAVAQTAILVDRAVSESREERARKKPAPLPPPKAKGRGRIKPSPAPPVEDDPDGMISTRRTAPATMSRVVSSSRGVLRGGSSKSSSRPPARRRRSWIGAPPSRSSWRARVRRSTLGRVRAGASRIVSSRCRGGAGSRADRRTRACWWRSTRR